MQGLSHKELLIDRYNQLRNWSPDPEEYGIQFGPSKETINEVINEIKRIDPDWLSYEEKELKKIKEKELETKKMVNIPIKELLPNLKVKQSLWVDDDYIKKSKKFLKQVEDRTLDSLSDKQILWVLRLIHIFDDSTIASRLAQYFQKTRR